MPALVFAPVDSRVTPIVLAVAGIAAMSSPACAAWTVQVLNPTGASASEIAGASQGQQAGFATITNRRRAGVWSGSAASWTLLHPSFATESQAYSTSGTEQVGFVFSSSLGIRACRWAGTPQSYVDLQPAGASQSYAFGTDGVRQVGQVNMGGTRASLWTGTSASWVDLNPEGIDRSAAYGISGSQQVGYTLAASADFEHAALWYGTPLSWIDLHPQFALYSFALATNGTQQVGHASFQNRDQAGMWSGSPFSWVNLNPPGSNGSVAYSLDSTYQVGVAYVTRACIWSGSAASHVDLHQYLPESYSESVATGVRHDGDTIHVSGHALNSATNRREAVLWTFVPDSLCPPCPADYDQDGGITGGDIAAFVADFEQGLTCADADQDGGVTGSDLALFFATFEAGGC